MVYLNKNQTEIYFPMNEKVGISKIICENQVSHKKIILDNLEYVMKGTSYLVKLNSVPSTFENGQYDYKLINISNEVIDEGILQYGDFDRTTTDYENENTIIQYKS